MEIRGIGIISVAAMFGVKKKRPPEKTLDLVVTLKAWGEVEDVDRARHGTGVCSRKCWTWTSRTSPSPSGRDATLRRLDRGRRVSDQVKNVRPQRRKGIERPPHRARDLYASQQQPVKIISANFIPHRLNVKCSKPMSAKKTDGQRLYKRAGDFERAGHPRPASRACFVRSRQPLRLRHLRGKGRRKNPTAKASWV